MGGRIRGRVEIDETRPADDRPSCWNRGCGDRRLAGREEDAARRNRLPHRLAPGDLQILAVHAAIDEAGGKAGRENTQRSGAVRFDEGGNVEPETVRDGFEIGSVIATIGDGYGMGWRGRYPTLRPVDKADFARQRCIPDLSGIVA